MTVRNRLKLISIFVLVIMSLSLMPVTGCSNKQSQAAANRWLALLNVIPANQETLTRAYADDWTYLFNEIMKYPPFTEEYMTGLREQHITTLAGLFDYVFQNLPLTYKYGAPLFGNQHLTSLPQHFGDAAYNQEWLKTVGYTEKNVEQRVLAGYGQGQYEAVRVDVSRETVTTAFKTGELNDMLKIEPYEGDDIYIWGEDNTIDLNHISLFRPLGRGGRMTYINGYVFWTGWTDGMKEMIDSYEGRTGSLAGREDYQDLVEGLADLNVYTAFFSSEPQTVSEAEETARKLESVSDPEIKAQGQRSQDDLNITLLQPFQAYATGVGIDENGSYMAIVLLNRDNVTATRNAELLEKRLSEYNDVGRNFIWDDEAKDIEIYSRGDLTLAKLYGDSIVENWNCPDRHGENTQYQPLLVYK